MKLEGLHCQMRTGGREGRPHFSTLGHRVREQIRNATPPMTLPVSLPEQLMLNKPSDHRMVFLATQSATSAIVGYLPLAGALAEFSFIFN